MRSKELRNFIDEIKYRNRNPRDNSVLTLLDDNKTNPEIVINTGDLLFRSRIVEGEEFLNKEKGFYGYDAEKSYVPRWELATDMRANYRFIPYLYCSNDAYISVIEVRPRFFAKVSVATIVVEKKLTLLDFTMQNIPIRMSDEKKRLFMDLSELFSTPVTNEVDVIEYIPTQYIAEYAKNLGYDGIVFKSSLYLDMVSQITSSEKSLEADKLLNKANFVIFNHHKCKPIASNVYIITENLLSCKQVDQDPFRMEIINPVEEALQKI